MARIWESRGIPSQSNNFTATVPVPKSYENYIVKNQLFMLTLRRIRCTLRKSKIPDRMRGCWDRKVTGTHILVHILCLRKNYLVVYNELKFK